MKNKFLLALILFFAIFLFFPLVFSLPICGNGICEIYTGQYGELKYSLNYYGLAGISETCSSCPTDCGLCPGAIGGSGGSGGSVWKPPDIVEESVEENVSFCFNDLDCEVGEYCFNRECSEIQCFENSKCDTEKGEVCFEHKCVKLFDVEILEFESPVRFGEFFNFEYLIKGMANISGDVEINFWIEQEDIIVTSGKDTIYLGSYETITKTKRLFLPSQVNAGVYQFNVEIKYEGYTVNAHRTIEISVNEGLATIKTIPERNYFFNYFIYWLIGFGALIVLLFYYLKKNLV